MYVVQVPPVQDDLGEGQLLGVRDVQEGSLLRTALSRWVGGLYENKLSRPTKTERLFSLISETWKVMASNVGRL